MTFFLTDDPF